MGTVNGTEDKVVVNFYMAGTALIPQYCLWSPITARHVPGEHS